MYSESSLEESWSKKRETGQMRMRQRMTGKERAEAAGTQRTSNAAQTRVSRKEEGSRNAITGGEWREGG